MKCKNIECENETKGKNIYCSLSCRNVYVNKYLRNYDVNKENNKIRRNDREKEYLLNPNRCQHCDEIIPFEKRLDNLKFCNNSCSASYTNGKREYIWGENISKGLKKYIKENGLFGALKNPHIPKIHKRILFNSEYLYELTCQFCGSIFTNRRCNKKYCSDLCISNKNKINVDEYTSYKNKTIFKFNLASYNDEFDFTLIETYGWYSPTNKNNNLEGVSRDHMLSVREGYELGIDPLLIAHPANCRLMKHTDNISKNKKSIITIEELLEKIKEFEQKYGEYYKK